MKALHLEKKSRTTDLTKPVQDYVFEMPFWLSQLTVVLKHYSAEPSPYSPD
jgi:hypothetical protein